MFFIQNIIHRWPLCFPIFLAGYEFRIERSRDLLRLSSNGPIFLYLYIRRTIARIGRMASIGTSGNQTEQYQESLAGGGVRLPISAFPSMF